MLYSAGLLHGAISAAAMGSLPVKQTGSSAIPYLVKDEPLLTCSKQPGGLSCTGLVIEDIAQAIAGSHNNSSSSSTSNGSSNTATLNQATDGSSQPVSLRQLLQLVQQQTWDDAKPQLNTVRRAVAVHLVLQAHGYQLAGLPNKDVAANLDPRCYNIPSNYAGGHYLLHCATSGTNP
jgi:hypothetical protein